MINLSGVLIDLHLHLDGSLSIKTIKELSKMQNIPIPEDDALSKALSVSDECADLNEYLEKFSLPLSLLQTPKALTIATYNLCQELQKQGLMYAEIRFAPQLHTQQGLSQLDATRAVIKGMRKSTFKANLILCCMRGDKNQHQNYETCLIARMFHKKGVCAIDLAGAEALYPTKNFQKFFEMANGAKIPLTIHCGEADGCESIRDALSGKPNRLGHGIRILEDEKLMKKVVRKGIYFELCPTSNLNTKIYSSYCEYPVKTMLKNGLNVTINTDNLTVSNTSIKDEFWKIIVGNNLNEKEVITLLRNAVNASFANKRLKKQMHRKINNTKEW